MIQRVVVLLIIISMVMTALSARSNRHRVKRAVAGGRCDWSDWSKCTECTAYQTRTRVNVTDDNNDDNNDNTDDTNSTHHHKKHNNDYCSENVTVTRYCIWNCTRPLSFWQENHYDSAATEIHAWPRKGNKELTKDNVNIKKNKKNGKDLVEDTTFLCDRTSPDASWLDIVLGTTTGASSGSSEPEPEASVSVGPTMASWDLLAQQFIAAKLNQAAGAEENDATNEKLKRVKKLLTCDGDTMPQSEDEDKALVDEVNELIAYLTSWNNGALDVLSCASLCSSASSEPTTPPTGSAETVSEPPSTPPTEESNPPSETPSESNPPSGGTQASDETASAPNESNPTGSGPSDKLTSQKAGASSLSGISALLLLAIVKFYY